MQSSFSVRMMAAGLAVASLVVLAAPAAEAQKSGRYYSKGSSRLTWRGTVDDTVELYIKGNSVRSVVRRGRQLQGVNYNFSRALVRGQTRVDLARESGRGDVRVIQQPNRANNFTAGVRIRDSQAGRNRYSFTLRW